MSGTTMQAIRTGGWANPVRGGELKFTDVNSAIAVGGAGVSTLEQASFSTDLQMVPMPQLELAERSI